MEEDQLMIDTSSSNKPVFNDKQYHIPNENAFKKVIKSMIFLLIKCVVQLGL